MKKFAGFFLISVFLSVCDVGAWSLWGIKKQNSEISGKIESNVRASRQTRKDLVRTAEKLSDLEEQETNLESKISQLEKQKSELMTQISKNNENLSDAAAGLVAAGIMTVNFDPRDMDDYLVTGAILSATSEKIDSDMRAAAEAIKELNKIQTKLEKQQGTYAATRKKHLREQTQLNALLRTRDNQNKKLREKQQELQKKLRELSAGARNVGELAGRVKSASGAVSVGRMVRSMRTPVGGRLTTGFGQRDPYGLMSDGWRIRSRSAALVSAPAEGKVVYAGEFRRRNTIIIDHDNGYLTVLTGMGDVNVLVGQNVLAGEPIGHMPAANPEMYLVLRRGNDAIDPARMFNVPR